MARPLSSRPRQPQIALADLREDEIAVIRAGFWRRVDTSGGPDACWPWLAHIKSNGYGCASYGRQRAGQAHRLSYELNVGPIPEGLSVCHNCPGGDRKDCVNPRHLLIGTNSENILDAVAKGTAATGDRHGMRLHPERAARGEHHGMAKLTAADVRSIRAQLTDGMTQREIARRSGICQTQVSKIHLGKVWSQVA